MWKFYITCTNLPDFYVDLFCSWSELKYLDVHKVKNIENVIIWYE